MVSPPPSAPEMTDTSPRVLIVDDQMDSVALMLSYLRGQSFDILVARDGEDGLRKAAKGCPDVILLDVAMPGMDGYAVCRRLREDPRTASVPVIFLSANTTLAHKLEGFAAGGADYIGKPFSAEEVLARIFVHLEFKRRLDRIEAVAADEAVRDIAAEQAGANDPVAEAIAHLQQAQGEWPVLAELARRVGTNEKKLTELFRRRFGMTVFEYLGDLRLETARRQLEGSAMQIQLIAARAGFGNASDFSRAFRRRYGIAPREYRQASAAEREDAPASDTEHRSAAD